MAPIQQGCDLMRAEPLYIEATTCGVISTVRTAFNDSSLMIDDNRDNIIAEEIKV